MDDGYNLEQLKFRSNHTPLVWDFVKEGSRERRLRLQDGFHLALLKSLTPPQFDAMCEIYAAYSSIVGGVGVRAFDPGYVRGTSGSVDKTAALVADYFSWAREVQRLKLDHAMSISIIYGGMSCKHVDAAYRQANGTAKKNLRSALDVFCRIRGWPTHNGNPEAIQR